MSLLMKKVIIFYFSLSFVLLAYADEALFNVLNTGVSCNASDDSSCANMDFGFTYERWGKAFTGAKQSTNGCVTLTDVNGANSGSCSYEVLLPGLNYTLYPFWTDLRNFSSTPKMAFKAFEDYVVFGWYDISIYSGSSSLNTFEVVLRKDGSYSFLYGDLNSGEQQVFIGEQGSAEETETYLNKTDSSQWSVFSALNQFPGAYSVPPSNTPAVLTGDLSATLLAGQSFIGVISANDIDGLADGSYFSIVLPPIYGAASINSASGQWSYQSANNFLGADPFTISLTDDLGGITQQVISVVVDEDDDSDGILNGLDNCRNVANVNQENLDDDALGDVCDTDKDGDGFSDIAEQAFGGNPLDSTDAADVMASVEAFSVSGQPLNRAVPAMGTVGLIALGLGMLCLGVVGLRRGR